MEDIDTDNGGEELSIDEAAAAYAKTTTEEVSDQSEDEEQDEGDTEAEAQESEDDSEEAEETGDEDQAGDEDADEDPEPETERGRYVAHDGRVRLPDGTEATVSDLIAGNLKNADATRKWQEAADMRRNAESESAANEASRKEIETEREFIASVLQQIVPQEPDPSMLQTDPMGYMTQKAERDRWIGYLNQVQANQQRTLQERQAKDAESQKEKGEKEWLALLEKAPDLKDQKKADRFVKDALEIGQSVYGFTREEIGQTGLDHRQAMVLRDAIAWRKLQASKANVQKKVEGRPPVQKGGKRLNPSEQRARSKNDATSRLKQTGRVDDAVAAYLAMKG